MFTGSQKVLYVEIRENPERSSPLFTSVVQEGKWQETILGQVLSVRS